MKDNIEKRNVKFRHCMLKYLHPETLTITGYYGSGLIRKAKRKEKAAMKAVLYDALSRYKLDTFTGVAFRHGTSMNAYLKPWYKKQV